MKPATSINVRPPTEGLLTAAIYARKSTEQTGVADEAKSVTRQIEHARAYATTKGWTVGEEYMYIDDGISGAEFAKRSGLMALIAALRPRPPFQVLVMSEEARLGREQIETPYILKQLITAGVRVFYYLEDRERTLDSPTEKLLLSVSAFADEMERVKGRARTRDAMQRKAKAGYVTGGVKFGYDNIEVPGPDGRRSHVDRCINPTQAVVVLRIFVLAAEGYGFRRIAHQLNAEGAPTPRAHQGRKAGWSASTVRDVLKSRIYIGDLTWGKSVKRDAWGQRHTGQSQRRRPADDWVRVDRPDLRIIPQDLWEAVQTRLRASSAAYLRATNGQLHGRPLNGVASKYLLTGLAVCGVCGGALTIRSRAQAGGRVHVYGCLTFHTKGPRVCGNRTGVPQHDAERAVLDTVQAGLLQPEDLVPILDEVLRQVQGDDATATRERLAAELATLEVQVGRLTEAIAAGGGVALAAGIKARETRQQAVRAELTALTRLAGVGRVDRARLERTLRERLTDWQGLLEREPGPARQMLRKLLEGRLAFTPTEDGSMVEFTGTGVLEPILEGVVAGTGVPLPKASGSPRGLQPVRAEG